MGLKHLRTTQSSPQEPLGDLQARGERSGTEAGFDPFAVAFYASCTLHACRVPRRAALVPSLGRVQVLHRGQRQELDSPNS